MTLQLSWSGTQSLVLTLLVVLALAPTGRAQNRAGTNEQPGSAMEQLLSGRGRQMIGRSVSLSHVAVQNLTQDDIVWVGNTASQSVLVMLQPSVNPIDAQGNPTPIAAGDQVRVTGHVIASPNAQVLQSWGVSPADAARVERQGAVLQAVTFEVIARNR